jgi:hypothetical protein
MKNKYILHKQFNTKIKESCIKNIQCHNSQEDLGVKGNHGKKDYVKESQSTGYLHELTESTECLFITISI